MMRRSNKAICVFLIGLACFFQSCGSDDDAPSAGTPDIDYTSDIAGDYEGDFTGIYSDATSNNFSERGFATVTKIDDNTARVNMQQGSRFDVTLEGESANRPEMSGITNARGRFEGANSISGFFNVGDEVIQYNINGNYSGGGTYEITFEGSIID